MSASRRALALSFALTIGLAVHARADSVPYVIVTDTTLVAPFKPLAAAHAGAGLATEIRTVQSIHAQYPAGRDDPERIRMFLKDAHALWGTRFVLLGGDDPLVPIRRVFDRGLGGPSIMLPTDQYYACLVGSWNADGDSLWGELPYPYLGEPGDSVDATPDLNVGRAPVTTPAEARIFVHRTLLALRRAKPSSTVDILLAATLTQLSFDTSIDYAVFAQQLLPTLSTIPGANPTRLYLNSAAWPGSLPESKPAVLSALNGDDELAVLVGPGGPGIFVAGVQPQDEITYSDLLGLTNSRPMLVWALSSYTNQPGAPSIGAALIRAPAGGAVAVLGVADLQLTPFGTQFMQTFFDQIANHHAPTLGEALSQAIASYPFAPISDVARLTSQGTILYGDPALPAPWTLHDSRPVGRALADADPSPDGASVPRASFALWGPTSNPVTSRLAVSFSLPDAAPARLELLDVMGRVLRRIEVGSQGQGRHVADLGAGGLPPGVYLLRLTREGRSLGARVCVLR